MKTQLETQQRRWRQQGYDAVVAALQAQNNTDPTEAEVRALCHKFLAEQKVFLPAETQKTMVDWITYSIVGLGPLEFLLRDEAISEIMVNGADTIFVERSGQLQKVDLSFASERQLIQVINRIVGPVGRRIDESTPLVDARLADGSRVNAIIPPLSLKGAVLTIRKFPTKSFTVEDMIGHESLNSQMRQFLTWAVESQKNILVSGGTGAGKTSTLNACASLIPHTERLITIEDAAEIRITHPHLIALESRASNVEGRGEIPIRTLLKNALRMRPDRIVVGEIRGEEAIDMLQAMNTGHKGSLTTVHANSPLESLFRVETMVLMGKVDLPLNAIRPQVAQAIDIVVQQERLPDGKRKITRISEVEGLDENQGYRVSDCFWYDLSTQKFCKSKTAPSLLKDSVHALTPQIRNFFN